PSSESSSLGVMTYGAASKPIRSALARSSEFMVAMYCIPSSPVTRAASSMARATCRSSTPSSILLSCTRKSGPLPARCAITAQVRSKQNIFMLEMPVLSSAAPCLGHGDALAFTRHEDLGPHCEQRPLRCDALGRYDHVVPPSRASWATGQSCGGTLKISHSPKK